MKIAVIGLGLIGGSIFKSLSSKKYDVIGISTSQRGENIYSDYSYLKDCDVVFVCTPMSKTVEILDKISAFVNPYAVVTDVCSLKVFLAQKEYPFNFIPSHPMAGTEFSGWENSFEGMFEGAKWVITPLENSKNTDVLEKLIKVMGATPVYTTPELHDEAVAMISHTPMVLAQALFSTASDNELAMKLASSGFRDTTRLAGSNPQMAVDMINLNSENIQQSLLKIYAKVGELLNNYGVENVSKIADMRKSMYKDGKNVI